MNANKKKLFMKILQRCGIAASNGNQVLAVKKSR